MNKDKLSQIILKSVIFYDEKLGIFERIVNSRRRKNTKIKAGTKTKNGYISIYINGYSYYAHRLAWIYVYGEWPIDKIDHINGNKEDNRIENLRQANSSENRENLKLKSNTKKSNLMLGVRYKRSNLKKPFSAQISKDGKYFHIGYYASEIEAHEAYLNAKRLMHAFCTI